GRWYWKAIRSVAVPLAIGVFLLVLLAAQPEQAQGPTVESDAPTGFTASGSKKDGWWNGRVEYTDAAGVLRREAHFWRGTKHGRWREWNDKGHLRVSGFYWKGERFGPWKWYQDGSILQHQDYEVFDITPNYILDRTAEVRDTGEPGRRLESFRYPNGQLQEVYTRVFGVVHGEQRFWDEGGKLTKTATWALGYPEPDKRDIDREKRQIAWNLHQEFALQLEEAMAEPIE
ncbi:MAG: hypothetical protein KDB32_07325, partial [Planctomycetes bacterium]|nr:hypothetical protein [Planctomycetota bacterium]